MNIYSYIILFWYAIGLGASIATHGQPQKPNNALDTIISAVILTVLLYLSGFFK
jgi:hypothetical protein